MGDDRHQRIRQRAYEIWEREGGGHGDPEKHWHQAEAEIEREDQLEAEQAFTDPSAVGTTVCRPSRESRAALRPPVPTS